MITSRLVRLAARRWPSELAPDLEEAWLAELAALRGRPWQRLAFAASLVVSPTADGPSWQDRGRALLPPIALTLVAGTFTSGIRVLNTHAGSAAAVPAALATLSLLVCVGRRLTASTTVVLAACLYAFLLAGNPEAVMPFMGWPDLAPAAAVWTAGTLLTLRARSRTAAFAGTAMTVELAVAAGALHGVTVLGIPLLSALAWPVQILGGTGTHPALTPNTAVVAGTLACASAFVLGGLVRAHRSGRAATAKRQRLKLRATWPLGIGVALGAVVVGEVLRQSPRTVDGVFGFTFLSHPAGVAVAALLVALAALPRDPELAVDRTTGL